MSKSQHVRIVGPIHMIVLCLIKFAIFLQVLRVFVPGKKRNWMFWTCHGLIWLHFFWYFADLLVKIFPCRPVQRFWNPWIKGTCIKIQQVYLATTAFNTASDILVVILPQPIIWKLQTSLKRKIGISLIFLVGVL